MNEFYPLPSSVSLEVADVSASAAWYREALGFRSVFEAPAGPGNQPAMVHLRRERHQELLLFPGRTASPDTAGQGVTINFLPGEKSVDAIAEEARAAGSPRVEGPVERPWNVRELTIYDLDGYRIRFSEPIDVGKSFEAVIGQAGAQIQ